MNWIIGLDLRAPGHGVLHFASWLAARTRGGGGEQFAGAHVLEAEHLRAVLRVRHLDEVIRDARRAALELVAREGTSSLVPDVDVLDALNADEGLEAVRIHRGAQAVIIGRAAERSGLHVVRLGRVARRTLRRLRSPVVVVPPDLREADLGDGPVVALTSLGEDSTEACRLAAALARALGLPLALVHVLSAPRAAVRAAPARNGGGAPADGIARLERWSASHDLNPDARAVLRGRVVERAVAFALEQRAPLLVVGSHLSSTIERVFRRSTASALAARAPLPVAVVPPRVGA